MAVSRKEAALDLHLGAQFHQSVARNPEEPRRRRGVAMHQREQLVAPDRHATVGGGDDGLAAGEEGGVHRVEVDATVVARAHQRPRHVRGFHVA
ncbi:hypothetical protein G6F32_017427 [Rhizopus arrhizus]|nr:hypothetical protein G6F32_017427 [Rhizopus arrhizus]